MSAEIRGHLNTSRRQHSPQIILAATCMSSLLAQTTAWGKEPADEQGHILERITVTAQKREENLQEVPISISVLGGAQLDSSTVGGLTEVLRDVPGVATAVAIQGGGTQLGIRGVTAPNPVFQGPSPIAYYLDGMPVGMAKTSVVPDANVYDLQRIEVLRGPQGTLYGTGGMGGVVRVLTHDANLDDFELKARASASGTKNGGEGYRGDMAANVPIVPGKLGARVAVSYQDNAGWIDRPIPSTKTDANESKLKNARLKLRAEPIDRLTLGLSAWISRSDSVASYSGDNRVLPNRALSEPIETNYDIFGLTASYDFDGFSVSNTASYLDYVNDGIISFAGTSIGQRTLFESDVFSNELTLYSTGDGEWRWSLGAIYRDSKDLTLTQLAGGLGIPSTNAEKSESFAVYGELTRILFDGKLELTGGLRYFEDHLTATEVSRGGGTPVGIFSRLQFDALSPRLIVKWLPSDDTTMYASYSEGFRSGFNQYAVLTSLPATQPDTLRNYELGFKQRWLQGRFGLDAAAYFIDWTDSQQALLVGTGPGGGGPYGSVGVNSESLSGPGFEFALSFEPMNGLTLAATYAWNDLTFDADVISGVVVLFPKGSRPNFSSETTMSGSISYDFPLGRGGFAAHLSTSANYVSALPVRRATAPPNPQIFQSTGDDLTTISANIGVTSRDANWTASLFVDNLANEERAFVKNWLGVSDWDMYQRPRTIGLQLEYRLGR